MSWRSAAFSVLCTLVLTPGLTGLAAVDLQAPVRERTVHVTVVDGDGRAVPNLTRADFSVREDGQTRPVLDAVPAIGPLAVTIIVNDKGADINEIRRGVATLMQRLEGHGEVSLISATPTVWRVLEFTTSAATMIAGVQRLVWRAGPSTGMLLPAITDAANELRTRPEGSRRAIVVVHFEGDEFRNLEPARNVLDALDRNQVRLHVVAVGAPTVRRMLPRSTFDAMADNSDVASEQASRADDWVVDEQNRNAVLGDGPRLTGGRRQNITSAQGLAAAMQAVASDLLFQYTIVYAGGEDDREKSLDVAVATKGATVLAPPRIPR
jgi:VWFA-related protein